MDSLDTMECAISGGAPTLTELWKSHLPQGKLGVNEVQKFHVTAAQSMITYVQNSRRFVPEGLYTRLLINGETMMSDTRAELDDHLVLINEAKGRVLIMGLGLGCILNVLANQVKVTEIVVVEKDKDIIDLISPWFKELYGHITFIHADAFEFKPTTEKGVIEYDYVWHDIWIDMSIDNNDQMAQLMETWHDRCTEQDCWGLMNLLSENVYLIETDQETHDAFEPLVKFNYIGGSYFNKIGL